MSFTAFRLHEGLRLLESTRREVARQERNRDRRFAYARRKRIAALSDAELRVEYANCTRKQNLHNVVSVSIRADVEREAALRWGRSWQNNITEGIK